MSNSDNEDVPNVLEAFTSLLDRMDHDFDPSDSSIIQSTIDRLGDSKDAMMAHLLLLKIMEKGWMSPKQLLDKLRPALVDKNAKLVEEALILLTATVKKFDPDKTISTDLLAEVVKVISSSTSESVQEAARKLLKCIVSREDQVDHPEVQVDHPEVQVDHPEVQVDHPEVQVDHPEVQVDHPDTTTPALTSATSSGVDHSVVEADKVDIEGIIENCINPEWRERKKNLKEMENILIEGHILTQTQLGKLTSNLGKLFGELHKQVFTSFLDVIKALVAAYPDDLDDWIDTACTWLFSQFCKENVKSIEEKIKGVLDVIRECLPGDQLLHVAMRCLNDPTLCRASSIGGRVAVLKFIQQIIETVDPCLPVESARAAQAPLALLLEDDSLDVKKHAQSCIVSLYNLYPQEMAGSSQGPSKTTLPGSNNQAAKPSAPPTEPSKTTLPGPTNQAAKPSASPAGSSKSIAPGPTNQAAKPSAPPVEPSKTTLPGSTNQAAKPSAPSAGPSKSIAPGPTNQAAKPSASPAVKNTNIIIINKNVNIQGPSEAIAPGPTNQAELSSKSNVPPLTNQAAEPLALPDMSSRAVVSAPTAGPAVRYESSSNSNFRASTMWPDEPFDPYGGSSRSNFPASAYQALYQMAAGQMAQRLNVSTSPSWGIQCAPSRMATRSYVRCGCKRCNCNTNHCTCRKNGARCGNDCDCVNCYN